jgi:hypothetical protein
LIRPLFGWTDEIALVRSVSRAVDGDVLLPFLSTVAFEFARDANEQCMCRGDMFKLVSIAASFERTGRNDATEVAKTLVTQTHDARYGSGRGGHGDQFNATTTATDVSFTSRRVLGHQASRTQIRRPLLLLLWLLQLLKLQLI